MKCLFTNQMLIIAEELPFHLKNPKYSLEELINETVFCMENDNGSGHNLMFGLGCESIFV